MTLMHLVFLLVMVGSLILSDYFLQTNTFFQRHKRLVLLLNILLVALFTALTPSPRGNLKLIGVGIISLVVALMIKPKK
jgi:hypothetical protein